MSLKLLLKHNTYIDILLISLINTNLCSFCRAIHGFSLGLDYPSLQKMFWKFVILFNDKMKIHLNC